MAKLYLDKEQKSKLTMKYNLSPSTLSEIIHVKRPNCRRHAEIVNYAVNTLGAKIIM